MDISKLTSKELLNLHTEIAEALRFRGIIRTANNPTGDLAEYLFCKAFGWKLENNSSAHIDATGPDGIRYQIKGRRLTKNKSRQMSAIRNLDGGHFDCLAGVLFTEKYAVYKAAIIPVSLITARSKYISHTNSHKFLLHDDVWKAPNVRDVTEELNAVIF